MADSKKHPDKPGMKKVFRPWVTHPKTGKRVYPKHGKVFVFWVEA